MSENSAKRLVMLGRSLPAPLPARRTLRCSNNTALPGGGHLSYSLKSLEGVI